ncbi:MAG: hypothetical protein WBJ37_04740 [Bacteroidales bacterium]
MENIRLEYQKVIDQTTSIYATIFSGIIVFSMPNIFPLSPKSSSIITVAGALLSVVSFVWWFKINYWHKLLKAELKYKAENNQDFKNYNDFIIAELKALPKKPKEKDIQYTYFIEDTLPKLLCILSFTAMVVGILALLLSSLIHHK